MNARRPFFQRTFVDWKSRWTSAFGSCSRTSATRRSSAATASDIARPKRVPRQCFAKRSCSHFQVSASNGAVRFAGRSSAAPSALNAASASTTFTYSSSVILRSEPAFSRTSVFVAGSS